MPSNQAVTVNPSLLAWAREQSGYGVDRVAKRMQVKEERVTEWESGKRPPTLRQVENLARVFHRPLSVFFTPRPPQLRSFTLKALANSSPGFALKP